MFASEGMYVCVHTCLLAGVMVMEGLGIGDRDCIIVLAG